MSDRASGEGAGQHQSVAEAALDSYVSLLGLLCLTFFLLSLVNFDRLASVPAEVMQVSVTIVTAGMLLLALRTSGARPRTLRIAAVIAGLAIAGNVIGVITNAELGPGIFWVALVVAAPFFVLRRIGQHDQVSLQTLVGAVCAYLLIALAYSYTFLALNGRPNLFFGAEQPTTAFPYFSLVTISTLGYGDLAPATELGRIIAASEAIVGQVFLVVVVARIVTLYSGRRSRGNERQSPPSSGAAEG